MWLDFECLEDLLVGSEFVDLVYFFSVGFVGFEIFVESDQWFEVLIGFL